MWPPAGLYLLLLVKRLINTCVSRPMPLGMWTPLAIGAKAPAQFMCQGRAEAGKTAFLGQARLHVGRIRAHGRHPTVPLCPSAFVH